MDSIEDEADFYFVKDQKLSRKNDFFTIVSLNQNYHFRHLNNMLTAIGMYLLDKSKTRYAFYFNFRLW